MNRPLHLPNSSLFADGLLLVSGFVLIALALFVIASGSRRQAAQSRDPEATKPVGVQADLQSNLESAISSAHLIQIRLSDWLDRELRREERAIRRKGIC